jgi:hypothetical protein
MVDIKERENRRAQSAQLLARQFALVPYPTKQHGRIEQELGRHELTHCGESSRELFV